MVSFSWWNLIEFYKDGFEDKLVLGKSRRGIDKVVGLYKDMEGLDIRVYIVFV